VSAESIPSPSSVPLIRLPQQVTPPSKVGVTVQPAKGSGETFPQPFSLL
jgi:hypothetical protein